MPRSATSLRLYKSGVIVREGEQKRNISTSSLLRRRRRRLPRDERTNERTNEWERERCTGRLVTSLHARACDDGNREKSLSIRILSATKLQIQQRIDRLGNKEGKKLFRARSSVPLLVITWRIEHFKSPTFYAWQRIFLIEIVFFSLFDAVLQNAHSHSHSLENMQRSSNRKDMTKETFITLIDAKHVRKNNRCSEKPDIALIQRIQPSAVSIFVIANGWSSLWRQGCRRVSADVCFIDEEKQEESEERSTRSEARFATGVDDRVGWTEWSTRNNLNDCKREQSEPFVLLPVLCVTVENCGSGECPWGWIQTRGNEIACFLEI